MTRRFTFITVALVAVVAFLLGLMLAGGPARRSAVVARDTSPVRAPAAISRSGSPLVVDFADVAARLNPAVVNIEAGTRARGGAFGERRPLPPNHPPIPEEDLEGGDPHGGIGDAPQEGTGSGFIIEPDGHILTNHHVIEGADRIVVKLADGRSLRATVVGSDPAIDVALIRVSSPSPLPVAPLGDSSRLRVGEWVCAIGNPLAYEHTVTVGVVSYLGRKLFDASLDDFIQTDAAINFGNSGGPLINARGEVIGINAAVSWRASNIGFAIPINQAAAIVGQLKASGRVARGYLGVTLKELEPGVGETLGLGTRTGALVQDVADESPAARAGVQVYDVIVSIDGREVRDNDALIRTVSGLAPGTLVKLGLMRKQTRSEVTVRLTERPGAEGAAPTRGVRPGRGDGRSRAVPRVPTAALGLQVKDLDRATVRRFGVEPAVRGVLIVAVEPLSAAEEGGVERGDIVLEVNRLQTPTLADFLRVVGEAREGDVLVLYCYVPGLGQRALKTLRVESWSE